MKIIDLLNKIAKGEEVPQEFKYQGCIFKQIEENEYESDNLSFSTFINYDFSNLKDEIEIIEEDTTDIKIMREIPDLVLPAKQEELNVIFQERINELIRVVKQLNKKIKEEE